MQGDDDDKYRRRRRGGGAVLFGLSAQGVIIAALCACALVAVVTYQLATRGSVPPPATAGVGSAAGGLGQDLEVQQGQTGQIQQPAQLGQPAQGSMAGAAGAVQPEQVPPAAEPEATGDPQAAPAPAKRIRTPEERRAEVVQQKAEAARIWAEAEAAARQELGRVGTRRERMAKGRKMPADFTRIPVKPDWPDCSNAPPPVRHTLIDGRLTPRKYFVYDTATPPVFRMTVRELDSRGWQRVDKRSLCEAELVFTNGQRRFGWSKLARHHIPNHLFEERKVADKSTLADHLALMREEGTRTPFWPETYWLRDVVDRAVFLKVLEADPTPQPPFLIKDPTQHRGRGVRFLEDKDVEKVMERLATKTPDQDKHGHDIVQRYVPNPLLLPPHGRKFDLRVYWLIASTNPVRVYYHDGTTRSSLESFDPDNMEDMGQHLTNVAVQKQNKELYASSKEELRLDFDQLSDILKATFPSHPDPIEDVRAQIRHAIATVFLSDKEQLSETRYTDRAFSLVGGDFIIDDNLQVWLLEIQEGPVRSTMTHQTLELWLDMTAEQIDILFEIEEHLKSGGPKSVPRDLQSVRNFQLVVDDQGEVMRPVDHLPVAREILLGADGGYRTTAEKLQAAAAAAGRAD